MFKLAELFVNVVGRTQQVESQLDRVRDKIGKTTGAFGVMVGSLGADLVSRGLALLPSIFEKTISAAADMNEQVSKLGVIFGESSKIIFAQADIMAAKFGTVRAEAIGGASSLGMLFKAVGFSSAEAAERGSRLAKLAADVSSQDNIRFEDVIEKFRAGLSGESEPVKNLGVFMNEEKVAKTAKDMGGGNAKSIDDRAKVMARAEIITKALARAEGDLERTISSTANATRAAQGNLLNLGESVGQTLLPIWDQAVAGFNTMVASMVTGFTNNRAAIQDWAESVVSGIDRVVIYWSEMPKIWEAVGAAFAANLGPFAEVPSRIAKNFQILGEYISNNWTKLIADAFKAIEALVLNYLGNLAEAIESVFDFLSDPSQGFKPEFRPLLEGFRATADTLPEFMMLSLTNKSDELQEKAVDIFVGIEEKAQARIEARRKQAAQAAQAVKGKGAAGGETDAKTTSPEVLGFTEFRRKLTATLEASGEKKQEELMKQQLEIFKQTRDEVKKVRTIFEGGNPAMLG